MLFATNDRTLGTCFVGKDCQADLPIYLWAHLHKHRLYFEKDTDTCLFLINYRYPGYGSPLLWVFRAILPVLFFRLRKTIISFRILMLTTKTSFPDP